MSSAAVRLDQAAILATLTCSALISPVVSLLFYRRRKLYPINGIPISLTIPAHLGVPLFILEPYLYLWHSPAESRMDVDSQSFALDCRMRYISTYFRCFPTVAFLIAQLLHMLITYEIHLLKATVRSQSIVRLLHHQETSKKAKSSEIYGTQIENDGRTMQFPRSAARGMRHLVLLQKYRAWMVAIAISLETFLGILPATYYLVVIYTNEELARSYCIADDSSAPGDIDQNRSGQRQEWAFAIYAFASFFPILFMVYRLRKVKDSFAFKRHIRLVSILALIGPIPLNILSAFLPHAQGYLVSRWYRVGYSLVLLSYNVLCGIIPLIASYREEFIRRRILSFATTTGGGANTPAIGSRNDDVSVSQGRGGISGESSSQPTEKDDAVKARQHLEMVRKITRSDTIALSNCICCFHGLRMKRNRTLPVASGKEPRFRTEKVSTGFLASLALVKCVGDLRLLLYRDCAEAHKTLDAFQKYLIGEFSVENALFIGNTRALFRLDPLEKVAQLCERRVLAQKICYLFIDGTSPTAINLCMDSRDAIMTKIEYIKLHSQETTQHPRAGDSGRQPGSLGSSVAGIIKRTLKTAGTLGKIIISDGLENRKGHVRPLRVANVLREASEVHHSAHQKGNAAIATAEPAIVGSRADSSTDLEPLWRDLMESLREVETEILMILLDPFHRFARRELRLLARNQ